LVNSRLGRFSAASSSSIPRRDVTLLRRPFSRSYGAILPSSLTRVLPIALVFSTCLPVSVLVRARPTSLDAFLGGMASGTSPVRARHPVSGLRATDFPIARPTRLPQVDHRLGFPSLPRPAIGGNGWYVVQEYQPVGHRLRLSASA
jgi:hypothetical protein